MSRAWRSRPTRDAAHGDMATNAAMVAGEARGAESAPRSRSRWPSRLAAHPLLASAEPAGPGFVNLRLSTEALLGQIPVILRAGEGLW